MLIKGSQPNAVASTNSGRIDGGTTGVSLLYSRLVNTRVIASGTTGVDITYYGVVDNQASGTISGTAGISGRNGTVVNAGTINGGVDFVSASSFNASPDTFVDNGGVVTDAIRLGAGDDLLVIDLVQPDGRAFAGATGGVDAGAGTGFESVIYRVGADGTTQLDLPATFDCISYDLSNRRAADADHAWS